jgi:SAM-dependent methyltransferase
MDSMKERQHIQEEEYRFPYHWHVRDDTRKGMVFHGYWRLALELAGNLADKIVLDAGCGDGFFTFLLTEEKEAVTKIVGVDYSERAITFARLLVPRASFVAADLRSLPFVGAYFDSIFLVEVLEHIPLEQRAVVVAELARVLKPGGRLIVTVPSIFQPVIDKHEEHFTIKTLRAALAPHFSEYETIIGQDRAGWFGKIFLISWRLWDNRFWRIKPLAAFWTKILYRRFLNKTLPQRGRRIIGVFRK